MFIGVWGMLPNKQIGGSRVSGNLPFKPFLYRKALLANYSDAFFLISAIVTFFAIFLSAHCQNAIFVL